MTLKVFNAEEQCVSIACYDGERTGNETGIAAFTNAENNKILTTKPFSLGNSICGFAIKRKDYLNFAIMEEYWLNPIALDTPFAGIKLNEKARSQVQVEENQARIDYLIKKYIG